jgi:hypothetical protein
MSAVVWANILLALPFLAAFIGVPLWLTFNRPEAAPDHADTRAYLAARSALPTTPTRQQAQRVKTAA